MTLDYGRISVHPGGENHELYHEWNDAWEYYNEDSREYSESFIIWLTNKTVVHGMAEPATSADWESAYDMYLRDSVIVSEECDECGETSYARVAASDSGHHAECNSCSEVLFYSKS
jgi:hypothetical protein